MTGNRDDLAETTFVPASELLEVACDESGYEGENLIGATTDVFAHASVRLDSEAAANCIHEIRDRIRSPALEYKSGHLLREKHRWVLEWLLGPAGPIQGNAHVHLIDKTFFVVARVVDLVLGQISYEAGAGLRRDQQARAMAVLLYHEGQRTFGRQQWENFLKSFNDLMRAKSRPGPRTSVDSFFRMVESLRSAAHQEADWPISGWSTPARIHGFKLPTSLPGWHERSPRRSSTTVVTQSSVGYCDHMSMHFPSGATTGAGPCWEKIAHPEGCPIRRAEGPAWPGLPQIDSGGDPLLPGRCGHTEPYDLVRD